MTLYAGDYELVFPRDVQRLHFATLDNLIWNIFSVRWYPISKSDAVAIRRLLYQVGQISRVGLGRYRVPGIVKFVILPPPFVPPPRKYYRNIGAIGIIFTSPGTSIESETGVFGLDCKGITESENKCDNYDILEAIAEYIYNYSGDFWAIKLNAIQFSENISAKEINEEIDYDEIPIIDEHTIGCDKYRFTIGFYDSRHPDELIYFAAGHIVKEEPSKYIFMVDDSVSLYYTTPGEEPFAKGTGWYNYFNKGQQIEVDRI